MIHGCFRPGDASEIELLPSKAFHHDTPVEDYWRVTAHRDQADPGWRSSVFVQGSATGGHRHHHAGAGDHYRQVTGDHDQLRVVAGGKSPIAVTEPPA